MASTNVEEEAKPQNPEIVTPETGTASKNKAVEVMPLIIDGLPRREYMDMLGESEEVVIYDSIWTVQVTDSIKLFPGFQRESIFFRACRRKWDNSKIYKALYNGGYKAWYAVYSCKRVEDSLTFENFTLDMVISNVKSHLDPEPISFKFVTRTDPSWSPARGQVLLGSKMPHPYLYMEVHINKSKGRFYASWAKPREIITDPTSGRLLHVGFTRQDRRWLSQRSEIDLERMISEAAQLNQDEKTRDWSLSWTRVQ
ncbi:hypothetical protein VTL71DRAFT_9643 [Oculimacula yallundae]|uniref:Uncharacterized protein n=1 Tax=Oculimacula yallundae TaxID=86028 RepID=A0ABR4BUA4_9HELO